MNWTEVRDLFRNWREENVRKSQDVVDMWESTLQRKAHKLGDEQFLVLEQVFIAALDCNRMDVADDCLDTLSVQFKDSIRIDRLQALKLEAQERFDEALELLLLIIKRDKTNAAPRKRRVAILRACGRIPEAIKELTEYLKNFNNVLRQQKHLATELQSGSLRRFMIDQEAWQELCDLYLMEQDFARAAFCMEELILHNPHSHLIHQRFAEIKYTQGGSENMELARAHYSLAVKLNPNNMRALYGLFLCSSNIYVSTKATSQKKKVAKKLAAWTLKQINDRYEEKCHEESQVLPLEGLVSALQLTDAP